MISRGGTGLARPVLIRRDFMPKRPTRRSLLAAAPLFALALAFAVPLLRGHGVTGGPLMMIMTMEFLVLWALFLLGGFAASNHGFARYVLVGWYVIVFVAVAGLLAWSTRDVWPLVGFVAVLAGKARTFFARDQVVAREVLWVRALLGLAVAFGLLVVSAVARDAGTALWGVLYFTVAGLGEAYGVLVPDHGDA